MYSYTPEMIQAERELDARIDHALGVAREVEARLDELERQETEQEPPPPDEDVERLKAFVLGYARSPEWERVIDRIDEGELTWRQVYESPFTQRADRQIAAAFESLSTVPPPTEAKLAEIGVLPADPEPPAEPGAARTGGPGRRRIVEWPN
ncbi:hypothetical protein [Actinophytocola sp.]|jgi:hypothetical protein|uniref:hypothetical protein n=1 Tax=Actinophytocola sp. TaxID=1872138 RepID=UPI002EDB995D